MKVEGNPIAAFKLDSATPGDFKQLVVDFTTWAKAQPPAPALDLTDGWTVFTPETSLAFLMHTVQRGGNRKVSYGTVAYYGDQMVMNDWRKTGQPIICDTAGNGLDGQHRCWASVLTDKSFPTYVVTSTEPAADLFAYIDNSKPRRADDALYTAGLDGYSRIAAAVVQLARRYDADVMTPSSKGKINKASPMQVLGYVRDHAGIREAITLMQSEHAEAMALMLRTDVAIFIGWKILEGFGEDTLDEFMRGLVAADPEDNAGRLAGDPLIALRKKLDTYAELDAKAGSIIGGKKQKKAQWVQILAHIIKGFTAWHNHQTMKTVTVRVDQAFPKFTDASDDEAAAA
jgi:hypothetical protein